MPPSDLIDAEATDLRVHVQLCAQRHTQINGRLGRIEAALWSAIALIAGAGWVPWDKIAPIARALASIP